MNHFQRVLEVSIFVHICPIYLSPYINFVEQILKYIKGRNSIKQQDVKPILDVSIHRHVWNICKEF